MQKEVFLLPLFSGVALSGLLPWISAQKYRSGKALLFIFLFFSLHGYSQQRVKNFIAYGKETGLTQNSYHDVFESSDGFLWIGSSSGLFKFDGKRFTQILFSYNNPNSPGDNNIVDIEEDNNGNLWFAGFVSGVTKYNLKTGTFKQYKRLSADGNSIYATSSIYKDSEGTVWIGTLGRGLAKYLPGKDTFRLYYPKPLQSIDGSRYGENFVTDIIEDNTNKELLWLSCHDGLFRFNKKTNQFTEYKTTFRDNVEFPLSYLCIEQSGNQVYLGTWFMGLVLFDKDTEQFKRIPYNNPGKDVYHYGMLDLQKVSDSVIYVAAMNDGLLCFNNKTRVVSPALVPADVSYLNTEINIQRVSLTPHAGFFAGGNSNIYQLHPKATPFNKYIEYSFPKLFPKERMSISCMEYNKRQNGYWASIFGYNGIVNISDDFSSFQYYSSENKKSWFKDLAADAKNGIWAITNNDELYYLNRITKNLEPASRFSPDIMAGIDDRFREVEADAQGNIWIAGYKGMYYCGIISKKIISFLYPTAKILQYNKNGIEYLSLETDSRNNAWMSTNAGLFKFDIQTNQTIYYADSMNAKEKLASIRIKSFTIDKDDNLWLGYFNEGIQKINTGKMQIEKSFGPESGLPAMEINYMACDSANNIIACLHPGLAIYKSSVGIWQVFNGNDGLQRDYLDVPVFSGASNQIILDQRNSFVVFTIDSLSSGSDSAYTHITTLQVNGKPYSENILPDYIDTILLPSSTRDIFIEFSVTNWQSPFRTKYFYRLDGIHESGNWIASNDATVNFTGISSGKYTFRFYAIAGDGKKSKERILQIKIKHPFYKTEWFILLSVLTISSLIYSIFKYRVNQIKKVQAIRNNISRDLHDDIGSSLSNINILTELARRNTGNPVKSNEYLSKAGEDIQRISESLGDIVWNINPKYDELENLFIRMKRYAADMMDGKNIDCQFSFPEKISNIKLEMEKRRDLYLIFKEAVNNLAKYSKATKATIKFSVDNNHIKLLVQDNGVGFDKETLLVGNGMQNMQQRAALLRGKLEINSQINKGTMLQLDMPV